MLKEVYPGKNYRDGYRDICKFLEVNGFEHRQWSGYVSKTAMSNLLINKLVERLINAFPWLKECVNRFDVTDIGEQHDLMYIFEKTTEPILNEKAPEYQITKEKRFERRGIISRSSIKVNAKIVADKQRTDRKPERDNDKSR
ncbi:hypothetical protein GMA13_01610 [Ruminococcus sp. zg-924]|nr:hypothetical protein [Ruminococcus sp. zg-924]MCQ4114162.1 hypothetical protein [Ruminococcus sp. zg-921]